MAISEKQAIIIGVGGLATLYLLRGKLSASGLLPKKAAAKGGPASTVSSAQRPSTNLATKGATATRPAVASTVGQVRFPVGSGEVSFDPFAAVSKILGAFGVGRPSAPKPPVAQPKPGQQPKPSSTQSGGSPSGGSSSGRPTLSPGGNPWSPNGDFVGRSTVTSDSPWGSNVPSYDTAANYDAAGDYGVADLAPGVAPQNASLLDAAYASMDADGAPSSDPAALEYDGYIDDTGSYVPWDYSDGGPVAAAPLAPLDSTPVDPYGVLGPADDYASAGPTNMDASSAYDGYIGDDGSYYDSGGGDAGAGYDSFSYDE